MPSLKWLLAFHSDLPIYSKVMTSEEGLASDLLGMDLKIQIRLSQFFYEKIFYPEHICIFLF